MNCIKERKRSNELHGMSNSPTYKSWLSMKGRCYNPKMTKFNRYGGRGIKVCERWKNSFANFYKDMGDKPSSKHTLERIDNNGNYTPENCKWATWSQQNDNRSFKNVAKSGYRGVYKRETENKWYASIAINSKNRHLGYFDTKEEAFNARKEAEKKKAEGRIMV